MSLTKFLLLRVGSRALHKNEFDSEGIAIEAASWVLQLDNGELNTADREALREWVGRSPAHASAIREYASMWMSIDDLLLDANAVQQDAYSFQWNSFFTLNSFKRASRVLAPVLALVLFAVVTVPQYFAETSVELTKTEAIIYSTKLGEQAKFKLADGSMVHLNTASTIEVEYQPTRRLIHLIKGEAHFAVKPDKARPFDVIAREKQISAVGTAFVVRLTDAGLKVTVTEGLVGISPASAPVSLAKAEITEFQATLEPNEHMIVERGKTVIAKTKTIVMNRELSWRKGVLKFEDDSLAYVLDEVSRYTDTRIVLADSTLGELRIGGLFKTGEISPLLEALELSFDLLVDHIDEKTIYLSAKIATNASS